jgi:hypothetical protein
MKGCRAQVVRLLQQRGPLSRTAIEARIEDYAPATVALTVYMLRRDGYLQQVRRASRYRTSLYGVSMVSQEEIPEATMTVLSQAGWVWLRGRVGTSGLHLHTMGRFPETGLGGSLRRYAEEEERSVSGWEWEAEQA